MEEGSTVDASALEHKKLPNLFASVLVSGINHLARRGLDQNYIGREEELTAIRGRILVLETSRRMLPPQGRAKCEFDELSVDTLENQILKSTLKLLTQLSELDRSLANKVLLLCRSLSAISDIQVSRSSFRQVQLHRNNRYYKFLLDVCKLVVENLIVDETSGELVFREFVEDEKAMAKLFESFIFHFIRINRRDLQVKKEKIRWDATAENLADLNFLPSMETDISVRSKDRTLIIDAKYYLNTLSDFHGSTSVHSNNLYQIFSYLKNLEVRQGSDKNASGMLLYPKVDSPINLKIHVQGHDIFVRTIDLSQQWSVIHNDLMALLENAFYTESATKIAV